MFLTEPLTAITQHGVRLALTEQDAENLRCEAVPVHNDISPSALITTALEYEAQQ